MERLEARTQEEFDRLVGERPDALVVLTLQDTLRVKRPGRPVLSVPRSVEISS
jgi:hypothetical protein